MKADDTYHYLRIKATIAAQALSVHRGAEEQVELYSQKLIDCIRKHNETHGLPLLHMAEA